MIYLSKTLRVIFATGMLSAATSILDGRGPRPNELGASPHPIGAEGVVWYSTWDTAQAEAKRSGRPMFFMAAAHQCRNVSGTF